MRIRGECLERRWPIPKDRDWQCAQLEDIGAHLTNPLTRFTPYRDATASGHGIGKSADIGMIVNWALDTHEDTRVVVTANTEPQIRTKLWPEIIKWRNLSITRDWWKTPRRGYSRSFQVTKRVGAPTP
jgi:hypothetical protein